MAKRALTEVEKYHMLTRECRKDFERKTKQCEQDTGELDPFLLAKNQTWLVDTVESQSGELKRKFEDLLSNQVQNSNDLTKSKKGKQSYGVGAYATAGSKSYF